MKLVFFSNVTPNNSRMPPQNTIQLLKNYSELLKTTQNYSSSPITLTGPPEALNGRVRNLTQ